jgi:pantothenate kinase
MKGSGMAFATTADVGDLSDELRLRAARTGKRQILGIVGAPASGKSTLAQMLALELASEGSVVVPMDGFHLANEIIDGTPLRERKGAIDTFDGWGYLSLLRRLVARDEPVVYAPTYRRGLEEPIAAAIAIPKDVTFLITEGNYLLVDDEPWNQVRELLDDVWFVETPHALRMNRLIERHVAVGMDRPAAEKWANGPDEANARFIESTRHRANRVLLWQ